MTPAISILVPIYNGEKYLQESLDSIYQQSFQDFEIIVVDDGSTDQTAAIIHSQTDSRIRYFKNEKNSGIIVTLNNGLKHCQGKYIARMDADDLSLSDRLQKQWEYMEAHPDVVLCGTSINKFSTSYSFEDHRGGDDAQIRAKLVFDTAINHPSAIFRNDIIQQNHLQYPADYPHAEDYGFWYTLCQYGKIANLPEILVRYRMHGDNVSMKFNHLQYDSMNLIRSKILGDFWADKGSSGEKWMADFNRLIALHRISIPEMKEMGTLLNQLVLTNEKTHQYNPQALAKNAAWFWYVVYVHENCQRFFPAMALTFLTGKKYVSRYLEPVYRKKLFIKSLLFWRKK